MLYTSKGIEIDQFTFVNCMYTVCYLYMISYTISDIKPFIEIMYVVLLTITAWNSYCKTPNFNDKNMSDH